jgi:serine/threonine protein kinase
MKKRHCNNTLELNEALQEIVILGRVCSPYIVAFRNVVVRDLMIENRLMFELYIIMDYHSGGDLFNMMKKVNYCDYCDWVHLKTIFLCSI